MAPAQLASVADVDLSQLHDIPDSVQNSLLNIVMIGVGGYVIARLKGGRPVTPKPQTMHRPGRV